MDEILVQALGFQVSCGFSRLLSLKPLPLIDRVNQLAKGIRRFPTHDE
jgi:hypothetical protein